MEKVEAVEARFTELGRLLEETAGDYQRAVELAKERAEIEPVVNKATQYREIYRKLGEAEDSRGFRGRRIERTGPNGA